MASMIVTSTLSKLHVRTGKFVATLPRLNFQGRRRFAMATYDEAAETAKQAAKKGVDATKRGGQQAKNQTISTIESAAEKTKDIAGKVSETAQEAVGKVKQTAQDAWGTVKDTTQKIKDTVAAKAETAAESAKDTIREEAAKVERSTRN